MTGENGTTGEDVQRAEMERYTERVRAALADLPADERDELTEDLHTHLADVVAETSGPAETGGPAGTSTSLESRLGSPEEYAAELRRSAGIPPAEAPPQRPPLGAGLRSAASKVSTQLDRYPAWVRFRAFLPELRPGWWVLRALIAVAVLMAIAGSTSLLLFLPLAGLASWVSVAIGRRSGPGRWRPWLTGANLALAIGGLAFAVQATDRPYSYADQVSYAPSGAGLANLHLYDKDGHPLRDVQAFDQWGNPLDLSDPGPAWFGPAGEVRNVYPRPVFPGNGEWQPSDTVPPIAPQPPDPLNPRMPAPSTSTTASATPSPSASPNASPSATATPSATPAASPSPR
ncbi:MAG: hypothetical protein QOI35_2185 [Cryptosporangiaceae bacterium]|nr:hypothetical protein [Cryptosporangiaceae bacterium]